MKTKQEIISELGIGKTIVAFHIGRGGRFNNAGHKSFIGEKKISDFVDELFTRYENQKEVAERFNNAQVRNAVIEAIDQGDIATIAKFGVTMDELGEEEYYQGASGGAVGLTVKEAATGIGTINIDHEYDTTYTCRLEDCDDDEIELMSRTAGYLGTDVHALVDALEAQEAVD